MKCEHGAGHTTMGVLGSIGFGLATAMGLSNANGNGNGFLGASLEATTIRRRP